MKKYVKWTCDFGTFDIPADVPCVFRKDGWFDKRRKITPRLRAYFDEMSLRMWRRESILTWKQWEAL